MQLDRSSTPKGFRPDERPTTNDQRSSFVVRRWSAAEFVFMAGLTSVIVIGWVALVLAQFGSLTRTPLLLALSGVFLITIILALRAFRYRLPAPQFTIHNFDWRDLVLAGILAVAAIAYTPPADYAPAFLDAGWYTNTGALIARTGGFTARPPVLEELPTADRDLFVRTYHDLKASMPRFPDRQDLGFYNLVFAIDLGHDGPMVPYHPPFASVWIAVLRLVGGPGLGAYAAPLFGLLFVLAVYTASRAVLGSNVALVGALLTALSPPVVYYARTPFAELLAGALIWGGVYAMSRYAATSGYSPRPEVRGPKKAPERGAPTLLRTPAPLLLFAGLAFGAALLVKIESLLLLPPITLFWLIWLHRRWATRRELVTFLMPFGILLGHAVLLLVTVLRPYAVLNGYGISSILITMLNQPAAWAALTVIYAGGIGTLIAVRRGYISALQKRVHLVALTLPPAPSLSQNWEREGVPSAARRGWERAQAAASLAILAGASIVLLLAWPISPTDSPSGSPTWSSLVTLGLFLTPLALCLGIVGLSTLVADDLNRRTAFLVLLMGIAGLVTVLMPAISSNVSHLYTIRRQLPIVVPALLLLTGYVTLRWAGLAEGDWCPPQQPAGLRRVLVILLFALLVINFLDAGRPLIQHQELAGSSTFIAELAQSFDPDDVVLFESVDRGARVGRFAAPLWAEYGVPAMLLSATYPPQDRLTDAIQRWQERGRRVYFVSQSQPPPFTLPNFHWKLADKQYWAGSTLAAKMSFPPETWMVEVPFYIYELVPFQFPF